MGEQPTKESVEAQTAPSEFELWRGAFQDWQRGPAGHINIQHYAQVADDCSQAIARELGFTAASDVGPVVRCQSEQLRFLVELSPGTPLVATGAVEEVVDGWIVHNGTLRRVRDDRAVCVFRRRVRPFRLGSSFSDSSFDAWPGPVLEEASNRLVEPIAALADVDAPSATGPGLETFRGIVEFDETDELDLLTARGLWNKLTNALWAAQNEIGADRDTIKRLGLSGGAALFDLTHLEQIPLGTPTVIRTSVLEARERSLRMEHCLLDARTDEPLVQARYVIAFADASSAKRVALPTHIRHAAAALQQS